MKKRPILFSAAMVRAILEDRKTQTRRMVRQQPIPASTDPNVYGWPGEDGTLVSTDEADGDVGPCCPYGQPGDRLWVRETHTFCPRHPSAKRWSYQPEEARVLYRADGDIRLSGPYGPHDVKWRPSIFMPRWASRITLELSSVRVERLKDISVADVLAEGCTITSPAFPKAAYLELWDRINGPGSAEDNPWVWVLEFKRVGA